MYSVSDKSKIVLRIFLCIYGNVTQRWSYAIDLELPDSFENIYEEKHANSNHSLQILSERFWYMLDELHSTMSCIVKDTYTIILVEAVAGLAVHIRLEK